MYPLDRSTSTPNPGTPDSGLDPAHPTIERLVWRLADVALALGISRRTLERERAAGRFPKADLHIGVSPRWRPATIRAWIDRGGQP